MTLSNGAIHDTILHVLTQHDRAESRRRSYNPFALALYMEALQSSMRFINGGADPREVLIGHFNGVILAKCLKALRMAPASDREENGSYVRRENYAQK